MIMKIAISVDGKDLSAQVDPRFGRARGFLLIDQESTESEHIDNPNIDASGGAGIQTAQMVTGRGAEAVITGNIGPNAFKVLEAAGVAVYTGASGTARESLEAYKEGRLNKSATASVGEKAGMAGGQGNPGPDYDSGQGRGGQGRGGRGRLRCR
jgi:predicted Fe-Mo cluster-binding NifX family protein